MVNLIIHTDYFSRVTPRIRIFTDRLEFFNPGSLPKKLEYILKEDFCLPRNPIIAKIFRYIRLAESIGSGFHKMIDGWKQHYETDPVIEGDFDYYKITFPLSGEPASGEKLGENEEKILALLSKDPTMPITELAGQIGISTTAVEKNIKKLKKKGLLERKGPAKGGHWEVKT